MAKPKGFLKTAGSFASGVIYQGVSFIKALRPAKGQIGAAASGPITFTYIGTDTEGEYEGKMFYYEEYFTNPSSVYSVSLGTASLAVAMACGNSYSGYRSGYRNIQTLLADMGFTDVEHNEAYETLSSLNTIGVAIGKKNLGDSTLICMGIRGIGYGSEWGANLLLGTGVFHQGFDEASDRALDFLKYYLESKSVNGRIKLWITGYSRSAATANLVAGKLDNSMSDGSLSLRIGPDVLLEKDDLYAYCFEPPETVLAEAYDVHGPQYSNIWNHINPNDPIPIMITSCYGMDRFGTDVIFPCEADSNYCGRRDRMIEYYRRLPNREQIGFYRTDFFKTFEFGSAKDVKEGYMWKNQVELMKDFNSKFAETLCSREFYVENFQAGLSKLVAEHNSYEGSERFRKYLRQALGDNKLSLAFALRALENEDIDGVKRYMRYPVHEAVVNAKLDAALTDELTDSVSEMLMLFKDFIKDNRLLAFNFLINAKTIFFAHYPELIFAWMMSMDPNYAL